MQEIIGRHLDDTVKRRLRNNPAVAILGPRQCGKTTLAGQIVGRIAKSVYLDLDACQHASWSYEEAGNQEAKTPVMEDR